METTLTTEKALKDIRALAGFFLESIDVKIPEDASYQYLWDKSLINVQFDNCVVAIDINGKQVTMQEVVTHNLLSSKVESVESPEPTGLPALLPSPLMDEDEPTEPPAEAHEEILSSTLKSLRHYMSEARTFGYYMYLSPDGYVSYPQNLPSDRRGAAFVEKLDDEQYQKLLDKIADDFANDDNITVNIDEDNDILELSWEV